MGFDAPLRQLHIAPGATHAPTDHRGTPSFAVPISPQVDDAVPMMSTMVVPTALVPEDATLGGGDSARAVPITTSTLPARSLKSALRLIDLAALALGFVLLGYELTRTSTISGRLTPGVLATVAATAVMGPLGLYRARCCARKGSQLARLTAAAACGGGAFALAQLRSGTPSWQVAACSAAALTTTVVGRWQFGRFLRARRAQGRYLRSVLLVGSNADSAELRTLVRSEPELGYAVVGVVAGDRVDPSLGDLPLVQSVADIPGLASATGANGIFVVPYALSSAAVEEAVSVACSAGLHVQVWPGLRGIGVQRLRSAPVSGEPLFYVEPMVSAAWQLAVKRAIDVLGAALALICTAPMLAVVALLVKLDSRGPVFYKGDRIGMHGRIIRPLKLRTMVVNDHPPSTIRALNQRTDGPLFKSSIDPRVTRIGAFLRSSSIDELPQLWNVLRGTMSLVGPRPALPEEAAQFDSEFQRRFRVRPGMTGLWQVEARHNPSFNAYRRLDLRYVDNWSLSLDVAILLATVPAVVSQAFRSIADYKQRF